MPAFASGRSLDGAFYAEVLAPQLVTTPHAAGLLGWGSDVLGFDTARSTDHGWGPRVLLFTADGTAPELDLPDWLMMPWQRVLEVAGGVVFHDDDGALTRVQELLAWYPDDGWRRYPPYATWLGSAFARLSLPLPDGAAAFSTLAELHGATGLTEPLDPSLRGHDDRPYAVLDCERFAEATRATLRDPRLRAFPLIGNVDQVCDSVDALDGAGLLHELRPLYDPLR